MIKAVDVSVIIPAYNAADYIERCLESVLVQHEVEYEIIVVDDCSTDGTDAVVRSIRSTRIHFCRLPRNHGGPSKPRNTGIGLAQGMFVAMLDSDDLLTPDSLRRRFEFLCRRPELGMVFCDALRFSDESGPHSSSFLCNYDHFHALRKREADEGCYIIEMADAYRGLLQGDFVLPSGVMMPKTIFDEIGGYDEALTNGQDLDMSLRIARRYPLGFLDMVGFRQRMHARSISNRGVSLAHNRITVLKKQLALDPSAAIVRLVRRRIAQNYNVIGYQHRSRGEMRSARAAYLESLRWRPNLRATRGMLLSCLARSAYERLRRYKTTLMRR